MASTHPSTSLLAFCGKLNIPSLIQIHFKEGSLFPMSQWLSLIAQVNEHARTLAPTEEDDEALQGNDLDMDVKLDNVSLRTNQTFSVLILGVEDFAPAVEIEGLWWSSTLDG